jgi:hypothetical protein
MNHQMESVPAGLSVRIPSIEQIAQPQIFYAVRLTTSQDEGIFTFGRRESLTSEIVGIHIDFQAAIDNFLAPADASSNKKSQTR